MVVSIQSLNFKNTTITMNMHLCYSYTIALSGLFELYVRGGYIFKPRGEVEWFKRVPRAYNSIDHDKAIV